jgi:hypothetical protein
LCAHDGENPMLTTRSSDKEPVEIKISNMFG